MAYSLAKEEAQRCENALVKARGDLSEAKSKVHDAEDALHSLLSADKNRAIIVLGDTAITVEYDEDRGTYSVYHDKIEQTL